MKWEIGIPKFYQTAYANEKFCSYLGCSFHKGQNLNFVYHNVVSKTTLVCTAVHNANAHSEWPIMINLDQSV